MTIFIYKEFDQKIRNQKYPCLRLVQYLETGESQRCQIGYKCLMKSYLMLQNAKFTAFTVSKFLRENNRKGAEGGYLTHPDYG